MMTRAVVLSSAVARHGTARRSPNGRSSGVRTASGVVSPGSGALPLTWAEGKNVVWKTAIHGRAWSSPVVMGDQSLGHDRDRRRARSVRGGRRSSDWEDSLRPETLSRAEHPQYAHPFNTYASPTPVIEPGRVYVTFGSPGTSAIDTRTGKVDVGAARSRVQSFPRRRLVADPVRNLLIMHFDGSDHQFVVALDKNTGKTAWRTKRSIAFNDLGPDGRAGGGRRFPQSVLDAACRGRAAESGSGEHRIEGDVRLRSAHGQGALEDRGTDQPLGQHASRERSRTRVLSTGFATGQLLAIRPDGKRRRHRFARRMESSARRTEQAVAPADRRFDLHGQRYRHRDLPRRTDGPRGLEGTRRWHLLGVADCGGRPHLSFQRGGQGNCHRGGAAVQDARRERA